MYRTFRDMPEMDAIRRCDSFRTMKEAGIQMDGESDENGAFICMAIVVAVIALIVVVVTW